MEVVDEINQVLEEAGQITYIKSFDHLIHSFPAILVTFYESYFHSTPDGVISNPTNTLDEVNNVEMTLTALRNYNKSRVTAHSLISGDLEALRGLIEIFSLVSRSLPKPNLKIPSVQSSNDINELDLILEKVNLLEERLNLEISQTQGFIDLRSEALKFKIAETEKLIATKEFHFGSNTFENDSFGSPCKVIPHQAKRKKKFKKKAKEIDAEMEFNETQTNNDQTVIPSRPSSGAPSKRKPMVRRMLAKDAQQPEKQRPGSAPMQKTSSSMKDNQSSSNQESKQHKNEFSVSANLEKYRLPNLHKNVAGEYTYNKWTGRKVTKQEYESFLAKRQELLNSIMLATETPHNSNANGNGNSKTISKRTEKTIEDYVTKMKSILDPAPPDTLKHFNQPRELSLYEMLSSYDLLISVEHCCDCEYHQATLRHQSQEYIFHAESILKATASYIHAKFPCVRLGVIRFPINSFCPKKPNHIVVEDESKRYGACEVQIAYRSSRGDLSFDLLHSKLKTRKWPSPGQLESRIDNFFVKNKIEIVVDPYYLTFETTHTEGIGSYPVGVGHWDDVPLAQPGWKYSWNFENSHSQTFDSIQWVFDSKSFAHNPKFADGTKIQVHFLPNKWGGRERYSIPATVRGSYKNTSGNLNMVKIQPDYSLDTEPLLDILEENCISLKSLEEGEGTDEFAPPTLIETVPPNGDTSLSHPFPEPLFLLLYVSHENGFVHHEEECSDGDHEDDEYEDNFEDPSPSPSPLENERTTTTTTTTRTTNFRLLRSELSRLAWESIQSNPGKEVGMMKHPFHWNLDVDVQLCYTEAMIQWILNYFSNNTPSPSRVITISHLINTLLSSPKYHSLKDEQLRKEKRKPFQVCDVPVPKETVFGFFEKPHKMAQLTIEDILFGDNETETEMAEYAEDDFEEVVEDLGGY